jgi:hypothetical protein
MRANSSDLIDVLKVVAQAVCLLLLITYAFIAACALSVIK